MCVQELRVLCDKSRSPYISVLEEYAVPHSLEGFAGEVTFQLGFKASVRVGMRGRMVQGEDIACARPWRRGISKLDVGSVGRMSDGWCVAGGRDGAGERGP